MLFWHQLPKVMVRQLGGWNSDEAMLEYLLLPEDVWAKELTERGLLHTAPDLSNPDSTTRVSRSKALLNNLDDMFAAADPGETDELARQLAAVFDEHDDIEITQQAVSGDSNTVDSVQTSLRQLE